MFCFYYPSNGKGLTIHGSFGGEVVDPQALEDPEKRKNFDLMAFLGRNSKDVRYPEIKAFTEALRKQYKKIGAIGFCYGKCDAKEREREKPALFS